MSCKTREGWALSRRKGDWRAPTTKASTPAPRPGENRKALRAVRPIGDSGTRAPHIQMTLSWHFPLLTTVLLLRKRPCARKYTLEPSRERGTTSSLNRFSGKEHGLFPSGPINMYNNKADVARRSQLVNQGKGEFFTQFLQLCRKN